MTKEIYALQDLAAPDGVCFGCGSKNAHGLRIKSYWDADQEHMMMTYTPDERYVGWPSLVYGGLISCLVDCHSNWTAMANHYRVEGREVGTGCSANSQGARRGEGWSQNARAMRSIRSRHIDGTGRHALISSRCRPFGKDRTQLIRPAR